ncbi:MAG: hydrolase [Clostridium sp.]
MNIFMEYENRVIQFPVSPEELMVKCEGKNEVKEIVKLGDISIAKDVGLSEIEFESFLPSENVYPFITTKNKFEKPPFYLDIINKIRKDKKPVRFIVDKTKINLLVLIESFDYGYKFGDEDVYYTIRLKEYREVKVKEVKISNNESKPSKKEEPKRAPATNKKVTTGCNVIVNGRLHRDSYGAGPGQTRKNYKGKVNFIQNGRKCPYHVTTPSGGWLGWVFKDAIKVL